MYIDFLQGLHVWHSSVLSDIFLLLPMLDCSTTGANGNSCRLAAVVSCCARHVSLLQAYLTYIYHTSFGFQDI